MRAEVVTSPDKNAVRAEIEQLVAREDFQGAIALAQSTADQSKDPEVHNLAIQLRIEAASRAKAQSQPRPDWPPALPDPFPECTGIPEIQAPQLNSDVLGGAILHHGSLIVRGLVPREEAASLANDIDNVFEAYVAWFKDENRTDSWFYPVDIPSPDMVSARKEQAGMGGIMAADSPAMFSRMVALYANSNVLPAIEGYLGERPVLSFGKTVARRVEPSPHLGEFHQDGAFLGNIRTVNVWIALSDCGQDSPGMEIVDRRLPGIVSPGTEDASCFWTVGRSVAQRANDGKPFARPAFKAGDALLFDEITLHATSYDEGMDKTRWALECWFFAPSASTDYAVPISI